MMTEREKKLVETIESLLDVIEMLNPPLDVRPRVDKIRQTLESFKLGPKPVHPMVKRLFGGSH